MLPFGQGVLLLALPLIVSCVQTKTQNYEETMQFFHDKFGTHHKPSYGFGEHASPGSASLLFSGSILGSTFRAPGPPVPMSPTMQCVISLTVQYFLLLLGLQIAQTYNQFCGDGRRTQLDRVFKNAQSSTEFCPMLAILFIAVRMRAKELDPAGAPLPWAQVWMFICTYSVLGQTILELISSLAAKWMHSHKKVLAAITSLKMLLMLGVYIGFTTVIVSIFHMMAPPGNINCPDCPPYTPTMAAALECTVNLTVQFFVIHLAMRLIFEYQKFYPNGTGNLLEIVEGAIETVRFCPILCVLFIGARMRALQLQTEPQPHCKEAFYMCSYAVLIQCLMKLALPFFTGAAFAERADDGSTYRDEEPGALSYVVTAIQYIAMAMMYGGVLIIVYCVLTIQAPTHLGAETPPVSPAMYCVMNLTCQFFAVFLLIELLRTYRELVTYGEKSNAEIALEEAKPSLAMIPMLCILFIGARLRALETDPVNGSPQKWAQMCMFICAWAVLVQTVMSILTSFFTGQLVDPNALEDDDRSEDEIGKADDNDEFWKVINEQVAKLLVIIRYTATVAIYGGFTAIIVSTVIIKPPDTGSR